LIGNAFGWNMTFLFISALGLLTAVAIAVFVPVQERDGAVPIRVTESEASASVVGMADRFPMILSFETAQMGGARSGLWGGFMRALCLDV
jgi:predicted MFS family arabinose efflux permease